MGTGRPAPSVLPSPSLIAIRRLWRQGIEGGHRRQQVVQLQSTNDAFIVVLERCNDVIQRFLVQNNVIEIVNRQ